MAITKLNLTGGNTPFDPNDPRTFPVGFSGFEDSIDAELAASDMASENQINVTQDGYGLPFCINVGGSNTYSPAAEWTMYYPFFVPFSWSASAASTVVSVAGAASGIARLGLCAWDVSSGSAFGAPGLLTTDFGTVPVDVTGQQTATAATGVLSPGWYASILVTDTASVSFLGPLLDQQIQGGRNVLVSGTEIRYRRYVSTDTAVKSTGLSDPLAGIINNSDAVRWPAVVSFSWSAE